MSFLEANSWWRCPDCNTENVQQLTFFTSYKIKEYPLDTWTLEECENCKHNFYVDITEPSPYCFKLDRGRCKNDYIKDMVLKADYSKLTIL